MFLFILAVCIGARNALLWANIYTCQHTYSIMYAAVLVTYKPSNQSQRIKHINNRGYYRLISIKRGFRSGITLNMFAKNDNTY